jgi:Fe-S cluster biogenesis protein NfuA
MLDTESVKNEIEKLRAILRADGGDLALVALEPDTGVVRLRLVLEDANCAECVMPGSHIAEVATQSLRRVAPDVSRVIVEDPRTPAADPA